MIDGSVFGPMDLEIPMASEIVKRKLYENGGVVTIPLLKGQLCKVWASCDGQAFTSDKLSYGHDHHVFYEYRVFDVIVALMRSSPGGRARKGNARGKEDKVGFGKCTSDTVMGTIATKYSGKSIGESAFDPVFVLAAILDWAGIAHNRRGYIELTAAYMALANNVKN